MATATQTVREIALQQPGSIRVFEQFGIDYCCGGRIPLDEACARNNVALGEVVEALEKASAGPAPQADEWASAPLGKLAVYIVNTHHAYVNRELPRLAVLADKVVARHGESRPELALIQAKVTELAEEMSAHQTKEELILFPHISRLENAQREGKPKPQGCFGSISNPIAMMTREHDSAGALVAEIRKLSHDFTPPEGACPTYNGFYAGLREFEQDLHRHIHLENNILFPRAIALEGQTA